MNKRRRYKAKARHRIDRLTHYGHQIGRKQLRRFLNAWKFNAAMRDQDPYGV